MLTTIDRCFSKRRIFSILLFLIASSIVSSCASSQNNSEINPENKYYSSAAYDVNSDGGQNVISILNSGGNKIVVLHSFDEEHNENHYKIKILGNDYRDVDIDSQGELLGSFCVVNSKLIASTYYGYVFYDLDTGKQLQKNDDLYVIVDESMPQVYQRGNGFIIVKKDCIYSVSEGGEVLSQIPYSEDAEFAECNTYFCSGDKDYLVLENNLTMQYYDIDFDNNKVSYICNNEDLGLDFEAVYRTGGFAYDDYKGIIYQIDPSNRAKEEFSYISNMLIKPMTATSEFDPVWFIFGKDEYAILYQYTVGRYEIISITQDDSLDLANRTKLTVRGYEANTNSALNYAAYLYNTKQNDYLFTIENYSLEEYGYSTAVEAQNSKLKLLKDFSSGNSPDVFYGNDFDYDQMGNEGLVLDIAPYLSDSNAISEKTITPQIYNLFFNNNHCYKVFPGYSMFGLWSCERFTNGNNSMRISDIKSSAYSNVLFADYYASDLADFAIRYPIKKIRSNGDFISENELKDIIQFAVDNGKEPTAEITHFANALSVANREYSLYLDYVGKIESFLTSQKYMRDTMQFVGFPSSSCNVHVAYPYCLVSVSAGTKYPEECIKFIELLFSDEVQNSLSYIPVSLKSFNAEISGADGDTSSFTKAIESIDTIMVNDWGLYNIIAEEINSYYLQGRSVDDIAHSMRSRIILYCEENGI